MPDAPVQIIANGSAAAPAAPVQLAANGGGSTPASAVQIAANGSAATPAAPVQIAADRTAGGALAAIIAGNASITIGGTPVAVAGTYPATGTLYEGKPTFSSGGIWPLALADDGVEIHFDPSQGWQINVHRDSFVGGWVDHDDIGDPPDLATPDLVESWVTGNPVTGTFTVTLQAAAFTPPQVTANGGAATPAAPPAIV
jgi:hypothetical protein